MNIQYAYQYDTQAAITNRRFHPGPPELCSLLCLSAVMNNEQQKSPYVEIPSMGAPPAQEEEKDEEKEEEEEEDVESGISFESTLPAVAELYQVTTKAALIASG